MTPSATESDKGTKELVELARRELRGDSVLSDEAGFARLQMKMARPPRRWGSGWVAGVAGLASAAAVGTVLLLSSAGSKTITFEVAGGKLGEHGQVIGGEATPALRIDRGGLGSVPRYMHGPLQPRHVRQIDQFTTRRKVGQEARQ